MTDVYDPLRVTVRPAKPAWEDEPREPAGAASGPLPITAKPAWEDEPKEPPKAEKAPPVIGGMEAGVTGAVQGITFGAAPAIAGLSEASGETGRRAVEMEQQAIEADPMAAAYAGGASLAKPLIGAFRMIRDAFSDHPDPGVKEAYERGRQAAVEHRDEAFKQHPYAYMGGMVGGSLVTPTFGMGAPAALTGRVVQGARAGGIGGGLFGVGTGISEGKTPLEIAQGLPVDVATGAALGGALQGAFGARPPATGPGAQAAATAERFGAPLPRGVTSERPSVQATTAKLRELPFVGERIPERVRRTEEAVQEHIRGIAAGMGQTTPSAADAVLLPALESTIRTNKGLVNTGYNAVNSLTDQGARFAMPRTNAVLNRIMLRRQAKGMRGAPGTPTDPARGLEQYVNVAGDATLEGARGARFDAREAGDVLVPHPGYNKNDFNALTRAMTEDMRQMVQDAAHNQTAAGRAAALRAFEEAERNFGRIADQNTAIYNLLRNKNPAEALVNAASREGGNLPLLMNLRNSMDPQDFQQIGGLLLSQLGHNTTAPNNFSLLQFQRKFADLDPRALGALFSPSHLRDIQDIVNMGRHIRGALSATSRGQSGGLIVLLDVAKDAVLLARDVTLGAAEGGSPLGWGTAIGAGTTAGLYTAAWLLGNPARAASAGAFARAYQAITLGRPTPARAAAFNIATRNLAHTLNVPVETVLRRAADHVRAQPAEPEKDEERAPAGR
jgi:hypothetical protein